MSETQYNADDAPVMAKIIHHYNTVAKDKNSFVETYSLKQGLKKFGTKAREAAFGEMKQLHDRKTFQPLHVADLLERERRRAMESLIFLTEKKDG